MVKICNKACKTDVYLDIKNYSYEKVLVGKLVLECEDEMFNTTETLLNDKKQHMQKAVSLFINNFMLVIISRHLC